MPTRDERTALRRDSSGRELSDEEIVQLVRLEIEHSLGHDAHVLGDHRAKALDFYHGNTQSSSIPSAPEGRCNIVSMDVHDTVNSLMAEVLPMMETSIVNFEPENEADEQAAQMESDFVRDALEKCNWGEIAYSLTHSALLEGLGWAKVEPEVQEKVRTQVIPYAVTDPIEMDTITQRTAAGQEIEVSVEGDTTILKTTTPKVVLRVDAAASENVIFSPSRGQYETEDLRFVAERKLFTVDELVQDYGLSENEASEIPSHEDDYWPGAIARRERYYGESDAHQGGWQEQTKLKECFCCYMDIALTEGGPTEKHYIMIGGRHLIKMYPVPFQPWVNGSPIPMPHRIQGRGLYEVMKDIQEAKTTLLRNLVDNAVVANGSRTAINENTVNIKDLTNGRVNGVVRVNGLPGEHISQMNAAEIVTHMTPVLQYLDEVRSSRGGASVDMNDAEMQTAKSSAEAAYNVKVSKEKMAGFYARNLVNSIMKGLYRKTHETLRTYFNEPMDAKIRGRWVQTNPAQWKEREHVRVTCGLTEVERRSKVSNLTFLAAQIDAIQQSGGDGVLTDVGKRYNCLADWVRCANIGQPEEYFLDPQSPESQQVQQERSQLMQQQQQYAAGLQRFEQVVEEMKIELDKYKHDTEMKFKYWKEGVESVENTEDNQTQLRIASINAQSNREQRSQNSE